MPDVFHRFWSFVDVRHQRDCWNWLGSLDACGYGVPDAGIQVAYREPLAHRVALALHRPRPAADFEAIHSCDNPSCCNPRHLRWGSQLDNTEDKRIGEWAVAALAARSAGDAIPDRDRRGVFVAVIVADDRAPLVLRRGLTRLDETAVRAIRSDFADGVSVRDIAAKYGVTQSHADSIAKRRIWRRVG